MQARLYRKTALSFLDQRSINEAAQNFAAGENVLQGTPSEAREWWLELIQNKIDQIWMYYTQNQPEIAEKIAEQVKPWLEDYGNAAQKARFCFGLTQIRMRQLRYAVTEEMLSIMGLGLQAAQESGSLHVVAELHFGYGFLLLWYGNWGEAEKELESAIEISERTGNVTMQARSLTYLVVLHRVRKDAQRVQEFLPQLEQVLTAAGLTEYMPYIPAIKAWFALRENQLDEARSLSQEAVTLLQKSPFKNPFHWLIRWPILSVAFQQGNLTEAIEQAKEMLMPAQQKLPDDLTAALEAAISAGEAKQPEAVRHSLAEALKLATEKGYL